jgi:tetraacyldisaccharide 4'-kinase
LATNEIERGSPFEALVSGRTRGPLAACQRIFLSAVSQAYRCAIRARNACYDARLRVRRLTAPVIAVGNITVGGTGKTPMTLWLCRHLLGRGLRPAAISRGYKAVGNAPSDELAMLARRCPEAVTFAHPDRWRAARRAIDECGADVIVLDDAFQHRRLARDLDIVLIDATCPFGYERLLPRGLLREPLSSLARAGLVVITRADQAQGADLDAIVRRLVAAAPGKPVLRAVHRPGGFVDLAGGPVEAPGRSRRVLLFAAIARPVAFERTVRDTGVLPVAARWYPDHHPYTVADVQELAALAAGAGADLLMTTEKDAVKLGGLQVNWPWPVLALRVDIDFLDDDGRIMVEAVDNVVRSVEARHAEEGSSPR